MMGVLWEFPIFLTVPDVAFICFLLRDPRFAIRDGRIWDPKTVHWVV